MLPLSQAGNFYQKQSANKNTESEDDQSWNASGTGIKMAISVS
jgi:hypothetical protein